MEPTDITCPGCGALLRVELPSPGELAGELAREVVQGPGYQNRRKTLVPLLVRGAVGGMVKALLGDDAPQEGRTPRKRKRKS